MSRWSERLIAAALLLAGGALGFMYVDRVNDGLSATGAAVTDFETALDAHIPFLAGFVFAYLAYYPFLLLPLPIVRERAHFYHAVTAFIVLELTALAVFIAVPSHMVRPEVLGPGLSNALVRWVYRVDQGWNLVPSLHVGHTVLVALFFRELAPKYFPAVALGTLLISLSTVFIKQHYVIDIPFGLFFAVGAYYATTPVRDYLQAVARARYGDALELSPQQRLVGRAKRE